MNAMTTHARFAHFAIAASLAGLMALSLSACSQKDVTTGKMEKTSLTHGQVQLTLKKGITTQSQVLEAFGAPNITTINETGNEEWSYQRHARVEESSESSSFATVFFFGGGRSSSEAASSSRSILLVIEFDENKIVSSFRSRTTSF